MIWVIAGSLSDGSMMDLAVGVTVGARVAARARVVTERRLTEDILQVSQCTALYAKPLRVSLIGLRYTGERRAATSRPQAQISSDLPDHCISKHV